MKKFIFAIFGFFLFVISFPKALAYEYNPNKDGEDFSPYLDKIVYCDLAQQDGQFKEDGGYGVFLYIDHIDGIYVSTTFQFNELIDFHPVILSTIIDDREWSYEGFFDLLGIESLYWNPWEQYWQIDYPISPDFRPVFEGETVFVTNVNNPMSVEEILSHIRLIDDEDGDVSHTITITTCDDASVGFNETFGGAGYQHYYVDHMFEVGDWYIFVKGHDTQGNYSGLKITVLVRDVDVPIINGLSNYNQSYTKKLNVDTILNSLSVSDNYDSSLEIILESDNYSSNYNSIGNYQILFSATDSSGNKGTFTVNINVVDDVAPVFSGTASILKGKSEVLTVDDIKDMLTANDFIDGQVEITVKTDNYTGNGNKVGKYTIVFQAQDSAGNVGTHTVEITVSDNIPPIFYVDNYFITVEQSLILTRDDIIAILQASGQLNIQSSTNIQFLLNEYEGNETVVGIYGITVKASSVDGSGQIFNLAVQVVEDEEGTVVHPGDPWYKQIGGWFVKAWDWLKQPVKENSWLRWGYIVGFGVIVLVFGFVRAFSYNGRRYRRRW